MNNELTERDDSKDVVNDEISETESIELVFEDLDNAATIWGVARRC